MFKSKLPDRFKELEPFVEAWALPTSTERHRKRLSSTMQEIQSFYDAILPSMDEIIDYLNQHPLNAMPEDARHLYYLTLSLAEIAPAVELFKQPAVVDGFDPTRFIAVRVPHMTPDEP
jgi:hypothetical protein